MGRPMILKAVLQMRRSIFLFETDIAGKNRYYNMSTLTLLYSCTTIVEVWGQLETILVFLVQSLLAPFVHPLNMGTRHQLVIKCYTKIFKGVRYLHSLTTNIIVVHQTGRWCGNQCRVLCIGHIQF